MTYSLCVRLRFLFFFSCLCSSLFHVDGSLSELMDALEIAQYWDEQTYTRFPVTYDHLLSTGYFVTHSARMTAEGEIGIGVAHTPPYLLWNGRIQPFDRLEFSANYRIFRGVKDQELSPHGFGDYADRGANFKYALITPEESEYMLPGLAFGIDDFMGSKKFTTYFIVGTKVWRKYALETSFGWGSGLYTQGPSRGFFGGFNWFPFLKCPNKWFEGVCLSAEYDPTNYKRDPHPDGKESNFPINFGLKYQLKGFLDLSVSYIRGKEFAAAGSLSYNFADFEGFIPKIGDPVPYVAPVNYEPLGCYRPENIMIQDMAYALEEQGFQLVQAHLCGENLWLSLIDCRYRQEHCARMRLQHLLASLLPENIDKATVTIESYGLPCQQYVYPRALLMRYTSHCIGPYEFDVLTPREGAQPPACDARRIFQRRLDLWRCRFSPRVENFFGSAAGKYKYDIGIKAEAEGFLPYDLFYEAQVSYTVLSDIGRLKDYDRYNPSQLPIVATDYVRYRQESAFTVDKLYFQKAWNLNHGCFSRAAGGYFQVNYGGLAGELLWYPPNSLIALGLEGAVVMKRNYSGLGFQRTLRKRKGMVETFRPYSTLQQYFLDLYIDFPAFQIFTKTSVGQFLAYDKGARLEATRYFDNGLRITGWITFTDAYDIVNGEKYYDRGIAIEVPFDFFYKCSSKRVWNHALAAWLRDAGYKTTTGIPLFEILNRERRW